MGPGHYEIRGLFEQGKPRGVSFNRVSGKPIQKLRPNHVGPGTYEIDKAYRPLYKMKPSPGFASKTLRSMDTRKIVKKVRTASSSQYNDGTPATRSHMPDEDSEEEDSMDEYINVADSL